MIICNLNTLDNSVIRKVEWSYGTNCALWLPLTTPHAMDVCAGDTEGNLLICTPNGGRQNTNSNVDL